MRRVLVLGSGGAGKSTFAQALGERTGLPVVHLDRHWWRPGWVEAPKSEFDAEIATLLARDAWVMDGNYSRTLSVRLAAADTAVLLDVPRLTCLFRVIVRAMRHRGRSRPDMTPGCPERVTWEFVQWIWTYPARRRPEVLAMLAEFERRGGRVAVLRTAAETRAFLESAGRETKR
jgi:adenylate kinase family enzyme